MTNNKQLLSATSSSPRAGTSFNKLALASGERLTARTTTIGAAKAGTSIAAACQTSPTTVTADGNGKGDIDSKFEQRTISSATTTPSIVISVAARTTKASISILAMAVTTTVVSTTAIGVITMAVATMTTATSVVVTS